MFEGASSSVFENAKQLRNNMTVAETVLWMHLKPGIENCRFRPQHPIGRFIADFYCHRAKLVVEVDGGVHDKEDVKKNDAEKEDFLANTGYAILRFSNEDVMRNIETVLEKIRIAVTINIRKHSPNIGG